MTIVAKSQVPEIYLNDLEEYNIFVEFSRHGLVLVWLDRESWQLLEYGLRQQGYLAFCPGDSVIENWIAWLVGLMRGARLALKLHFMCPQIKKILAFRDADCCRIRYLVRRKDGQELLALYDVDRWSRAQVSNLLALD